MARITKEQQIKEMKEAINNAHAKNKSINVALANTKDERDALKVENAKLKENATLSEKALDGCADEIARLNECVERVHKQNGVIGNAVLECKDKERLTQRKCDIHKEALSRATQAVFDLAHAVDELTSL